MPTGPFPQDFPHQQLPPRRSPAFDGAPGLTPLTDEEMAERRHQMRQATLEKEAAKQERAEMISEVMAHPAIAAHVALYGRILTTAERQAAAFEKIADALSRIAPTPEKLQREAEQEAEEAVLRREEQEARTQTWKSASQLMPSMVEQILSRMKDALDIPGGNDEGSVQ